MSRAVYIGGFSSGRRPVNRVAEALTTYFEEVDAFTFAEAMRNPDLVRKATRNVHAVTSSAGWLALKGTAPAEVLSFGAPLPRSRVRLIGATAAKTWQMHTNVLSLTDFGRALRFDAESTLELTTPTPNRGITHWRHFLNNDISSTHAIEEGKELTEVGIPVVLNYGLLEKYYFPTSEQKQQAESYGIRLVYDDDVHAFHDAIILNPERVVHDHFEYLA